MLKKGVTLYGVDFPIDSVGVLHSLDCPCENPLLKICILKLGLNSMDIIHISFLKSGRIFDKLEKKTRKPDKTL